MAELLDAVYCCTVADGYMWIGLVALLNSLYVAGCTEKLVVLDAGLTAAQRGALRPHCILSPPPAYRGHPALYKPFAPPREVAGTMVFVDSDAIVTGSLRLSIEAAQRGQICVFPDPESRRFFPEWAQLFGLRAEMRRQTYISSHLVVFSTRHWPELLARWRETCQRAFDRRVLVSPEDAPRNPFHAGDQDALNALLMSEVPQEALLLLPPEERAHATEARSVKIDDKATLACRREGRPVLYVHAGGMPKPWRAEARSQIRRDAYLKLMRRLLYGDGVAVELLDPRKAPAWLRPGLRGSAWLAALGMRNAARDRSFWVTLAKRILPNPVLESIRTYRQARMLTR